MLSTTHKTASILAFLTIVTFWLSTAISELFLDRAAVAVVKTAIPWGLLILIPALATAGATGFRLSRGRTAGLVGAKRRRMPFIAATGLLILVPAALFLARKAGMGEFDGAFRLVQGVELLGGASNVLLMGLNIRDGRRMTARQRLAR